MPWSEKPRWPTSGIPVFLDEAQSLVFEYDGYFFSNDKRAFRPLYSSVVRSVLVHDDCCTLTASGTGLRMKEALSGSHVGKGSIETILVTMDTFFSIDKVVSFTQDHLKFNLDDSIAECSLVDLEFCVCSWKN